MHRVKLYSHMHSQRRRKKLTIGRPSQSADHRPKATFFLFSSLGCRTLEPSTDRVCHVVPFHFTVPEYGALTHASAKST